MTIEEIVRTIGNLYRRIEQGNTGSPKQFSTELGISERNLYRIISSLRKEGFPIEYSRRISSYRLYSSSLGNNTHRLLALPSGGATIGVHQKIEGKMG